MLDEHPKIMITSTTIANIVVAHLKDVDNIKLANKSLSILIDSGSDENFISQKWTLYGKKEKCVHPWHGSLG